MEPICVVPVWYLVVVRYRGCTCVLSVWYRYGTYVVPVWYLCGTCVAPAYGSTGVVPLPTCVAPVWYLSNTGEVPTCVEEPILIQVMLVCRLTRLVVAAEEAGAAQQQLTALRCALGIIPGGGRRGGT